MAELSEVRGRAWEDVDVSSITLTWTIWNWTDIRIALIAHRVRWLMHVKPKPTVSSITLPLFRKIVL